MRIHITGGLTARSHEIAQSLAGRLGLDFMSTQHNFLFPVSYKEDATNLMLFWDTHEDCVVNALSIPVDPDDDAIHILLESELVFESNIPGTHYLQRKAEVQFKDCYDPEMYDIVVNVTGLSIEYVVQHIIDCIIDGRRGHYMPANILLPGDNFSILEGDLDSYFRYPDLLFRVSRFYSSCFLEDEFKQAQLYVHHNKLLRVSVFPVDEVSLLPMSEYERYGKCLGLDYERTLLGLMLSKYCSKFGLYDSDKTYCTLAQNGSPRKKLIEMGFYN